LKALREIGIRKAIRFGAGTTLLVLFRLMVFPPLRTLFLRGVGVKIGKNVTIHNVKLFNVYRRGFAGLKMGDNCFIGDDTLIDLADEITLEDDVTLAERVTILTHVNVGFRDHPLQAYFPSYSKGVVLKRGCFVGTNATILPGVTVGQCGFVGAGAVVREDVSPYHVVGGVPARTIRVLDELLA
jgi:acetyltransferase-like isoleucine patch superfamily enzyme